MKQRIKHKLSAFGRKHSAVAATLLAGIFPAATIAQTSCITWGTVGSAGISDGAVTGASMDFNNSNVPYISYKDQAHGGRSTVKKYVSGSWLNVGAEGFSEVADNPRVAVYGSNTTYLLYKISSGDRPKLMKHNGTSWSAVTSSSISFGAVSYHNLSLSSDGTPYIAYQDESSVVPDKAVVKKLNDTGWVTMGVAGFSPAACNGIKLTVDANDSLWVVFKDGGKSGKVTAMRYNGSSWVTVGSRGFSAGEANSPALVVYDHTPYVSYKDESISGKVVVKRFNGTSWELVGIEGFSASSVNTPVLAFDGSTPYVAYSDNAVGGKVTVKKYDGTQWVSVIADGISAGDIGAMEFEFNAGVPWMVYKDIATGDKATVMALNTTVNVTPVSGSATVAVGGTTALSNATPGGIWSSSNASTAFVSPGGIVTGAAAGTATISYSYDAVCGRLNATTVATVTATGGAYCRSWDSIGLGVVNISLLSVSMLVSSSGEPYVAYGNNALGGKMVVKKYNGSSWATIGSSGFTSGEASETDIAMATNGTVYVAYRDVANGDRITVMRYNGTSWSIVGAAGFSSGAAASMRIKLDDDDVPYVIYRNVAEGNVSMQRYNGSSWEYVGGSYVTSSYASSFSMAFDNNTPYVSYAHVSNVTVARLNGSSWQVVGSVISSGQSFYHDITIFNGTPYVAFTNQAIGGKVSVKKFYGGSWVAVGATGFSAGAAAYVDITIDGTGVPYVIYGDGSNGSKATVKMYDGSNWVDAGNAAFSRGEVYSSRIATTSNGTPYAAFADFATPGGIPQVGAKAYKLNTLLIEPIAGVGTVSVTGTTTLTNAAAGGTWSSSNTAKATIGSASGIVTGVATGTATMTYQFPSGCYVIKDITVTASKQGNNGMGSTHGTSDNAQLSPNPNNGTFTLSAVLPGTGNGAATVTVTDLLGRTVYTDELRAVDDRINKVLKITNTPCAGMYLLTLSSGNEKKVIRFTIE